MIDKLKYIWMDGKMVEWDRAQVHVLTHALHYGLGVFEGIRCYETSSGQGAVFRLQEHITRLFNSAKILGLEVGRDREEIIDACTRLLRENEISEAYLRPLVYSGDGAMGVYAPSNPVRISIAAWKWGAYLGDDGLKNGVRCRVSTFNRSHVNSWMSKSKTTGAYVNGILAKREAVLDGYDEAILLDSNGYVAEGSGQNLFIVRDGTLVTAPPPTVLEGITRDTVMKLAGDLGYDVNERRFSRDELYIADEAFFCGTAAEVTPICEVDRRSIASGKPGPITQQIQKAYFAAVRGDSPHSEKWLTFVE